MKFSYFNTENYMEDELTVFKVFSLTKSNTRFRKNSETLEQSCARFIGLRNSNTMDKLSCVESSKASPRIIALRNQNTTQYGVSFEAGIVWVPQAEPNGLIIALQTWVHVHNVLNLTVDNCFLNVYYFFTTIILQTVPLKDANSSAITQLFDQFKQLE